VITGAGTGIGRGIAECAAEAGASVTVVGRRKPPLDELAARYGEAIQVMPADVTEAGAADLVVAAAVRRFGRLDAIVNNAGMARFGALDRTDAGDVDAMFAVNVRAPAELVRCGLPELRAHRGSVVNISSVAGTLSMPGRAFYGASKAALNSLTRSLARELAPDVRVNAILPGPVDTPLWAEAGLSGPELAELRAGLAAATPMGRFGDGRDIGRWTCCLLDPELAGWVTGALIPVDGGRTS
jgi:NAD(P)-dependent dehydrogenase (short-subunit alcohol dehydrogenase family)